MLPSITLLLRSGIRRTPMVDYDVTSLDFSAPCIYNEPQLLECSDDGFGTICYSTISQLNRGPVLPERRRAQQDWDQSLDFSYFGYGPLSDVSVPSPYTGSSVELIPWDESENSSSWEYDLDTPYQYMDDGIQMGRFDSCISTPVEIPPPLPTASKRQLEPRVCKVCQRWFTTSYELEAHARSKSHATYTCDKLGCSRKYCRRDSYVRHMASHHNSPKYQCSICMEKSFKRRDHLLQHIRSAHMVNTPQLPTCKRPKQMQLLLHAPS